MPTHYHAINKTVPAVDTHISLATIEDKPAAVTSLTSVKNVSTTMLKPGNSAKCVILNNLHVPGDALVTNVEIYNTGLQARINHEYKPEGNTVFLLGSPKALETTASLSIPVSPLMLTQKLLSISNKKTYEFTVKSNGYV
jgi:hypothetical protein